MSDPSRLLPALAAVYVKLAAARDIGTAEFADAAEAVLPLFDKLGTVFSFARVELETKRASIAAASPTHPTLASMVSADVAAGVAATRGSAARNLHRVGLALSFLADLLARLAADPALALRAAAGAAYAGSLATCHTGILRAGVRAALYLLPDRASFMASLNESEASAAASAASLVPALRAVVSRVDALYSGVPSMPVSEVKWLPKSSGRKEGAGAG